MKILVLGSAGNLGQELVRASIAARHDTISLDRPVLDVFEPSALGRIIAEGDFGAVMNAVAWNDVDGAEDAAKREICWKLNAELPGMLARICQSRGTPLIHFSSDYVFKGDKPQGYREDDKPNPISEYGRSKLAGEAAVISSGGPHFIVRTSRLFGPPGASPLSKPSFVATMLKLAKQSPELHIVDEEVGCPTYTRDLAGAVVKLLDGYDEGIYHLVNEGPGATWYEFAEEIFRTVGIETPRLPVRATPRPAARPKFAPLLNTVGPRLRPRLEALRDYLQG